MDIYIYIYLYIGAVAGSGDADCECVHDLLGSCPRRFRVRECVWWLALANIYFIPYGYK